MKQLGFWDPIWDPMEIGWWIEWALQNKIREYPEYTHSVVTPTGEPVCGCVPNNHNGQRMTHVATSIGDGTLLHVTRLDNVR